MVPSASQWKRGVAGESRPFAGVNVLLLGDFYQLPPPSGGYLADVSSSRRPPRLSAAADAEPDLLADYGRNLVWGGALQGVTELEERERCKDDWWNEVVDELRRGELSEENWRYLHGKPVEGCRLTAAELPPAPASAEPRRTARRRPQTSGAATRPRGCSPRRGPC